MLVSLRRFQQLTSVAYGASSPYGKATHDDLSVASLLRYGCHRLTTICASLSSFKLCSLVQLMFAATPEGEPRLAAPSGVARELDSQGAVGD